MARSLSGDGARLGGRMVMGSLAIARGEILQLWAMAGIELVWMMVAHCGSAGDGRRGKEKIQMCFTIWKRT